MNIDELEKRLDNEFPKVYKTILIDGDWGIGKTYLIKKKYEKKENYETIYASIYGLNSISELNIYILRKIHKFLGFLKKGYDKISGKDLGIFNFTFNIPEIETKATNLLKRKSKKEKILIIIDDIERKSKNIDIDELMGFFEALSNIDNVKLILIANTKKIPGDDLKHFNDFKEKLIEKTYNIDSYSKSAKSAIVNKFLKDEKKLSDTVDKFFSRCNINNLRTLKKCIDFIKQNEEYLELNCLTEEQVVELVEFEICIVIEKISGEYMKNNNSEDSTSEVIYNNNLVSHINKKYYNSAILHYKRRIISLLSKIYDDECIEKNSRLIMDIYEEINNPKVEDIEKIDPFYLSKEQLMQRSKIFNEKYMNKIDDNLDVYQWFNKLSYLYYYSEKAGVENAFKEEDILRTMDLYIEKLDTSNIITNLNSLVMISETENEKIRELLMVLKSKISCKYYEKLFFEIKEDFYNKKYNYDKYQNLINNLNKEKEPEEIRKKLYEEEYFIPDLNGELNEAVWRYTHNIWERMSTVSDKADFIEIVKKRLKNATALGKYRIESLNKQYGIILE